MEMIRKTLLLPLLTRIGTGFGAYLVGSGVASTEAEQIAVGLVALVGVLLDLLNEKLSTRKAD